ncbi:MAG: 5-formyltetrahydrofolate cyclo-ligase [Desulfobacterales bacterium]|nr:5-formyltetrahydrofolate cyclo-ligase [Desulfobacterales bacterium]MBF0397178.1 5-formyltetrahydrofolate cyclo-ligase [Desulfobacterales bacterium]
MEDIKEKKNQLRQSIIKKITSISNNELKEKYENLKEKIFDFANFVEARIALLYMSNNGEAETKSIIKKSFEYNKIVVLPIFEAERNRFTLVKVDSIDGHFKEGHRGNLEPDPKKCKIVPMDCLDIAIIPGLAFDEKGGRIGTGKGYYDKLIPKIPITTRKVGIALEEQIVTQVPMESHDKYIDIIVTDKRVIYKI